MTRQTDVYYVKKTKDGIVIEQNSKTLMELLSSNKTIVGKDIIESIDFVNMDSFNFEITYGKVLEPKPEDVFYNYAWDFFNTFFTGVKDYFDNNKDVEKVELKVDETTFEQDASHEEVEEDIVEQTLFGEDDLPF